jgi:uncharacterized membrane protein
MDTTFTYLYRCTRCDGRMLLGASRRGLASIFILRLFYTHVCIYIVIVCMYVNALTLAPPLCFTTSILFTCTTHYTATFAPPKTRATQHATSHGTDGLN